jgi:hypothetical protein
MSRFTADWLALREPADSRARSASVVRWVAEGLPADRVIKVLDLASGTGANVRYLIDRLSRLQSWRLVDHDAVLLSVARDSAGTEVSTHILDLAQLDRHATGLFAGCDLVTASALLDLVSESWLRTTIECCREMSAALLFALSYDGRMECEPRDPEDETIRVLVNRHQRTDKGFGPALGPMAAGRAAALLREAGYEVARAPSDWRLSGEDLELQRQLIVGWAGAAAEIAPSDSASIADWRKRRLAHLAAGRSRILVGHEDVGGYCRRRPSSSVMNSG